MLIIFSCTYMLSSCENADNRDGTKNGEVEETPIGLLTDKEKILFEALIKMSKDFFEPSEIKILEIGDYSTIVSSQHMDFDTYMNFNNIVGKGESNYIVVKLQGENRVGGTLSHYYAVRLDTVKSFIVDNPQQKIEEVAEETCKTTWDECSDDEYPKTSFNTRQQYKRFLTNDYYANQYCTEEEATQGFGKYIELKDSTTIKKNCEDIFNIAKINKALKYYWDERLGNE